MSERRTGTLFLIPVALGGDDVQSVLAPVTAQIARGLTVYFAENAKSARAFLKAIGHPRPIQEIEIQVLDEHSDRHAIESLLARLVEGQDCGLVSEAGSPAVADPGSALVRRAHESGIAVVPLVGPSSILLALMGSGMDGQRFVFHGYLPVNKAERARRLKELDRQSQGATQLFIETPYRNTAMLQAVVESCRGDTLLCLAVDLTLPEGFVTTRAVAAWKKKPPALDRRQVVYLLYRGR